MTIREIKHNLMLVRNTLDVVEYRGEKNTACMYGAFNMIMQVIKDLDQIDVKPTRETSDVEMVLNKDE